jgi:flagellar hook-associated protein 3 FlgL
MLSMATRDIQRQSAEVYSLQQQAISGRRVQRIQDDPAAAARYRLICEAKSASEDHARNITLSRTNLEAADSALSEAGNLILRAKEIAVAMATDTMSAEERQVAAQEVESLYRAMLGLANTKVAGEFIFAGYSTDQRPFLADGTYVGDDGVKRVEVGQGATAEVSVSGSEAFTAAGGADIFGALEDLRQGLLADDVPAITASIDVMDDAQTQLISARADAGLKANGLDVAEAVRARLEDTLLAEASDLVDIDAVGVFLSLNAAMNSLQQAITVSSQLARTSLLE